MSAIVICMASAKGGSGKTTITSSFAAFLRQIGKKVLVIDCDEATHGLTLLYLDQINATAARDNNGRSPYLGIFDSGHYPIQNPNKDDDEVFDALKDLNTTLSKDKKTGSFLYVKVENGFSMIPATYYFTTKPQMEAKAFHARLAWLLSKSRSAFDYILLDAQAGSDVVSRVCMRRDVSDEVVIVSEYDPLSAAGVERLKAMMPEDLNFSRTWILLNKMLPEFVKSFSEFLSVARYLPPVPWTADVVRAYSRRKLALDLDAGNSYTIGILQTLKALVPHSDGLLLDTWASDKAAALRQPLDDQYRDAEVKRESIDKEIEEINLSRQFTTFKHNAAVIAGAAVVAIYAYLLSGNFFEWYFGDVIKTEFFVPAIIAIMTSFAILLLYINTVSKARRLKDDQRINVLIKQKRNVEDEVQKLESLRTADLVIMVNRKAVATAERNVNENKNREDDNDKSEIEEGK